MRENKRSCVVVVAAVAVAVAATTVVAVLTFMTHCGETLSDSHVPPTSDVGAKPARSECL